MERCDICAREARIWDGTVGARLCELVACFEIAWNIAHSKEED